MNQLLHKGSYVLRSRSLPFRWAVVNDGSFNAGCTAMDSVAINKGLLVGLHGDRDELAGVLGHDRELITGQNPASDLELAQELDRALQAK